MPDYTSNDYRTLLGDPTSDENRPARIKIIDDLGQLSADHQDIRWLAHFLQEGDFDLQLRAFLTLQKRPDLVKALLNDLIALLNRPNDMVQWREWRVCDLLSQIGPEALPALPSLQKLAKKNKLVAITIWKISHNLDLIMPLLIDLAKEPSEELCDLIYDIGPDAAPIVPFLRKALDDADADLRWAAVDALGAIGDRAEEAISDLVRMLADKSGVVAGRAAHALAKFGTKAVPALIGALQSPHDRIKEFAADALALIGEQAKDAIPHLEPLLRHPKQDVAWWCAIAYGTIAQSQTTLPFLAQVVDRSPDESVRLRAREAIKNIETRSCGTTKGEE